MDDLSAEQTPLTLADFVRAAKAHIEELTPEAAQIRIDQQSDCLVLDVREASEYEQGHIPGALLVPRGILEAAADPSYPKHVPALSGARQRSLLVYCATGGRSAMATATLKLMGFEQVANLEGGFSRWEEEGRAVAREARYV